MAFTGELLLAQAGIAGTLDADAGWGTSQVLFLVAAVLVMATAL